MQLYYITDRTQFSGDEVQRQRRLLQKIAEASRSGVNYIQLREKDLSARELETLAREATQAIRDCTDPRAGSGKRRTDLLINSRTDIALATGAGGVHLRSHDISPSDVTSIWKESSVGRAVSIPIVAASCHSADEVAMAAMESADFAVLAPVFEKRGSPNLHRAGLETLRQACRQPIPVFALGGVTLANAPFCADAGAAGIAAIRLFQDNDIAEVVRKLRG